MLLKLNFYKQILKRYEDLSSKVNGKDVFEGQLQASEFSIFSLSLLIKPILFEGLSQNRIK